MGQIAAPVVEHTDQEVQPSDLIFTAESARICNVSSETIRWWEKIGRLPAAVKAGRGVRLFDRRVVQRLADERKAAARG